MATRNNKRNNSVSSDFAPSKKSDEGSSQEEDLTDPKWVHLHHVGGAAALRFSARVVEKQEKLLQKQFPTSANLDSHSILESNELSIRSSSKKKRNWTLWSSDDKQYFFEGLNEFGKDFDAIQNYISLKLKSKRSSLITKNKDQVRHFYYRTWNKISKFLTFPEMKKAHQELYGLINYGELRKKQRVLNLKTAVKLSELVQKGSTTIKVRGKTFRIKTPVCRALKKLNRLEEPESKLPNKVILELIPENGQAWACVQNLSYNPRVRVHLSLQRSLSSVIKFFEERWKGIEVKMKEQLLQTFGKQIPRLRFIPQGNNMYHLPIFKVLEATSASKISLRNYADSVLRTEQKVVDFGVDDHDHENDNDTEDERMNVTFDHPLQQLQQPSTSDPVHSSHRQEEEDFLAKCSLSSASDCIKGWTADEAGMMTIGEVYLMLGNCSTIQFEYRWDKYENTVSQSLISKLMTISNLLKKKKCYKAKTTGGNQCPQCGYSPTGVCTTAQMSKSTPEIALTPNTHRAGDGSTILKQQPIVLNLEGMNTPRVQMPLQFLPTLNLTASQAQPQESTAAQTAQNNKSIILLPKGNKRLGRPANRKVIVPRVLPLRPKVDTSASGIFTITTTTAQNILHSVQQAHAQQQSLNAATLQHQHQGLSAAILQQHQSLPMVTSVHLESATTVSMTPSEFNDLIQLKPMNMNENSNFSLSSFLDITLPSSESSNQGTGGGSCLTSDKFLSCDDNSLLNLLDCKQNSSMEKKPEDQLLSNGPWLSSESNDLSLSSLLGNLEGNSVGGSTNPTAGDLSNGGDRIVSYLDDI